MEWKGDWSDNSLLWTDDLKKQLNVSNKNDGIFYMSEMDFLKYFTMSTICSYVDGHDNTTINVTSAKNQPKLIMI